MRVQLQGGHPALGFIRPLLGRNFELVDAGGSPKALVVFGPTTTVPQSVDRIVLVTDEPTPAISRVRTLVIGATPPAGVASHARLDTGHPAELLSLIDGFLRYPERFPAGGTREAAAV